MDETGFASLVDEPFQPSDLLSVQEEAIVSRTLIDEDGGTVTVFAMDEGQRISEHSAPHDALIQAISGSLSVTLDGTDHHLEAGEAIGMPADVPHAVAAPTPTVFMLTMIRP